MNDELDSELEQKMVNQLAREFLQEQRSHRRWNIFFKSLLALYLFTFLAIFLVGQTDLSSFGSSKHSALIDIRGVISMDSEANADYVASALRAAFKDENTAGVILRINSPGGSPVQSGYINDEIRRLRGEYPDIPLYAVIGDLCASGGYYIAVAADKIYADKASLVGSIGVIMAGFGFVDTIEKMGIERRIRHAGESKAFLDPFSPQKESELAHVDNLLADVHQQFIDTVKQGRGDRLVDDKRIFSGLIWTGEQSIELGLVDALGSAGYVAREIIGEEEIVNFTRRENYLDRFAGSVGASLASNLESLLNYHLK